MFISKELFEEKKVSLWISEYKAGLKKHDAPAAAAKVADEAVIVFKRRFQTETAEELINSQKVLALMDSVFKFRESLTVVLKAIDMLADDEQPDDEQLLKAADAYVNLINANKS